MMKTLLLALVVLSFAAVVPGAADAHIGPTGDCWWYDVEVNSSHWHVCASTEDITLPGGTTDVLA